MEKQHGPGTSSKPPRLTRAEKIDLELARQLQWVENHIRDTTSSAYLLGYRDALEHLDAKKGDV